MSTIHPDLTELETELADTPPATPDKPPVPYFKLGDALLGTFDYQRMRMQEASFFKRQTGMTPLQMLQRMDDGDPDALTALVWWQWRMNGRVVDYRDVDFAFGDFAVVNEDGTPFTPPEDTDEGPTGPRPSASAGSPR